MKKQRVLSGVQATGGQHLGNYLGALKRWAEIQETHECYYFIADLHAMTVDRSPEELTRSTIESAAILFASGLDPKKTTIFIQSQISAHSEFAWILNCITPMGWLNRMTQFKDKAGKDKESASAGLFTYPVLQSADILLYQPDLIPVGEDQKQHIELTRDIAGAVNRKCGYDFLKIPEPMIPKDVARVKSLRDGTKKMSKSDPSDQSRINLSDDDDTIISKFKKAKTDSIAEITYEPEKRPEIANLLSIYSELSGRNIVDLVNEYNDSGFAKFKTDLGDLVCSVVSPIRKRYNDLLLDKGELFRILKIGSEKAKVTAESTLEIVKKEFGIIKF